MTAAAGFFANNHALMLVFVSLVLLGWLLVLVRIERNMPMSAAEAIKVDGWTTPLPPGSFRFLNNLVRLSTGVRVMSASLMGLAPLWAIYAFLP